MLKVPELSNHANEKHNRFEIEKTTKSRGATVKSFTAIHTLF